MPTRPAGASRNFAGKTARAAPGCGSRSAMTRSLSISTPRAAPRRRRSVFGDALLDTVIVCDRYSAYKRLARLREGKVTLAFCWSHMRTRFCRVRGRPSEIDGLVPGMDRADRVDLPPERVEVGSLRPRDQAPDAGVRLAAQGASKEGARRACSRRPPGSWSACRTRRARAGRCAR